MVAFKQSVLLALLGYITANVAAHGVVINIKADDVSYTGYIPHAWEKKPTPGWAIPLDQDYGFIMSEGYTSEDIICHKGATPGALYVKVAAGDSIELEWTTWPEGHHGCLLSYIARCEGECTQADKTKLKFNKIDGECLIKPNPNVPIGKQTDLITAGYWAGDKLRANRNKRIVNLPHNLKAGKYVFRHEALAYQRAMVVGPNSGLQHYPQCINLEVTGAGTDDLGNSGTLGTDLYRVGQLGLPINIFANPATCVIPGPPFYNTGAMSPVSGTSSTDTPPSTTASPAQAGTPSAPPMDMNTNTTASAPAATTSAPPMDLNTSTTASAPAATTPADTQNPNLTSSPSSNPEIVDKQAKPSPTSQDFTVANLLNTIDESVAALRAKTGMGGNHARDLRNLKRFIR